MFGSEEDRSAAECYARLIAAERDLADLERRVLSRHPETMSEHQWRQMRAHYLNTLRQFRNHLIAEAEAIYGRSDTAGDYRGRD